MSEPTRILVAVADLGYGPVQVTALDRDGSDGNYAVFNARQLTWESA